MQKPRMKKSPAPTPAKVTGDELPMKTPKGSGPSVAPSLEERVAALERAVMTLAIHLPAAFFDETAHCDAATKKVLTRLEDRLLAAGTLARLRLPEEADDDAFEEWEALPSKPDARWKEVSRRLGGRLVALGSMDAERRVAVPLVTIDADAVHRKPGLVAKVGAGR